MQDLGVRIPRPLGNGPSRFIPEKEVGHNLFPLNHIYICLVTYSVPNYNFFPQILKISKVDTRTQTIFEDAFVTLGRLDNISVVMGFHPHYLTSFLRTQHYLLQMDGPLPLHYRHYIGIMVRLSRLLRRTNSPRRSFG